MSFHRSYDRISSLHYKYKRNRFGIVLYIGITCVQLICIFKRAFFVKYKRRKQGRKQMLKKVLLYL